MIRFKNYTKPKSTKEALSLLNGDAALVAGGVFINLSNINIDTAVDLSEVGLDFINEDKNVVEIGAFTTLRAVEKSLILQNNFGGIFSKAASFIMGIQLRNMATFGAPIYERIGFSNILTALLATKTKLVFTKNGVMDLDVFMQKGVTGSDILEKVIIQKEQSGKYSFQIFQKSTLDFAVLNVAVGKVGKNIRISVGARPSYAKLASCAQDEFIKSGEIKKVAEVASDELTFGSNLRGSKKYRKLLCKTLVEKALLEVKNG